MEQTARICAAYYGVFYSDLLYSTSKRGKLLKARQTAIYIMTEVQKETYDNVSIFFDKSRNVTGHYRKRTLKYMNHDENYKLEVNRLTEKIKSLNYGTV